MKQSILGFFFCTFLIAPVAVAKECFIVGDGDKFVRREGQCQTTQTPQSTFKIALGLMGYDSGILLSETTPSFPFKPDYVAGISVCKGDHNPREWMRDSCVWYSQVLTAKLGMEKFRHYVNGFDYGNKDLSAPKALESAWLGSSLRITPEEQVGFLQRMLAGKLSVSPMALELTKKILFVQELSGGWRLYGKTGNGRSAAGLQHGWFVGWIEKGARRRVFAQLLVDETKQTTYASHRARNQALLKLWDVIEELEK